MTNRDFPRLGGGGGRIPRDKLLIRRILSFHEDTLFETLEVKSFASEPVELQLEQWAGSRFDDLFEVRGYPRAKRGRSLPPREISFEGRPATALRYEGLDGLERSTFIQRLFETEKIRLSPVLVGHFTRVTLPPKGVAKFKTIVSFDRPSGAAFPEVPQRDSKASPFAGLTIESDSAIFNRAIHHAMTDIFMLLTEEGPSLLYPYAGIPWFSAPFGRDGVITAYQALPWSPSIARGVLDYAFGRLGTKVDAFTDEEPGKVFHEMRRGEMARTRELPFVPYYGSVDSTPLTLILLFEYVRWTMDLERLRGWWPHALRALEWIRQWGDSDGDGYLEYSRRSSHGLENQGWKDSHDSIMHADGKLAEPPIRLCEAQAYAFRARLGLSALAKLLGDDALAGELRLEALRLKARFLEDFWEPERGFVSLALDGERRPCRVLSSNMGHCLWAQMLPAEHARRVAAHLVSDSMFSGYGIRTLASSEVAYNPLSYHNGSVWPHDNSILLEGFRNYGFVPELEKLAGGLMSVLETSDDFRMPELYCGFRKRAHAPPVPYEVACKPQAWAAGSIFLMVKALLGMNLDFDQGTLVFNTPTLPAGIHSLELRGLKGRDWEVDLACRRSTGGTSIDVLRRSGPARVVVLRT